MHSAQHSPFRKQGLGALPVGLLRQIDKTPPRFIRNRPQQIGIGTGRGGNCENRRFKSRKIQHRPIFAAVIGKPVGEEKVGIHAVMRNKGLQVARPIIAHVRDLLTQLLPVAISDRYFFYRLRLISNHLESYRYVFVFIHDGLNQPKLRIPIPGLSRSGTIPENPYRLYLGERLGEFCRFTDHSAGNLRVKIRLPFKWLRCHLLPLSQRNGYQNQRIRAGNIYFFPLYVRGVSPLSAFFKIHAPEGGLLYDRQTGSALHLHRKRKGVQFFRAAEQQPIEPRVSFRG